MQSALYTAFPSLVKQAPDARALNKTTTLVLEGKPLSTPPIAQEYFEPGINTKLNRRSRPKTNFTLPSDLPEFPMGFVPINKNSGAELGEEPPRIKVRESIPGDLMNMFVKIAEQQKAESQAVEEAKQMDAMDVGSIVARQLGQAMTERNLEAKLTSLIRDGFSELEAKTAMETMRREEALKRAREPAKPVPVSQALEEVLGMRPKREIETQTEEVLGMRPKREIETQTELSVEPGKTLAVRPQKYKVRKEMF